LKLETIIPIELVDFTVFCMLYFQVPLNCMYYRLVEELSEIFYHLKITNVTVFVYF